MNWQSILTAAALFAIATVAGGAAFRLAGTLATPRVGATVALVVVLLLAVVVVTVGSLRRSSTPYW